MSNHSHAASSIHVVDLNDDVTLDLLLDVFYRVCDRFALDMEDEPLARDIARALIEAAVSGEDDPDALYRYALRVLIKA